MYDSSVDLLDALRATPAVLEGLLRGCTQEEARAARGGDEGWSVVEVICHLRDAEERAFERLEAMRDEIHPFLAAYNQERWAIERRYATADLHEACGAFVRLRTQHADALAALTPAQWERTGEHEEQGRITIKNQTIHMVSHDAIHAAQIARQLQR
jgi:DinB superfamily